MLGAKSGFVSLRRPALAGDDWLDR